MLSYVKRNDLLINLQEVTAINKNTGIIDNRKVYYIDFVCKCPVSGKEPVTGMTSITPCRYSFLYETKPERDKAFNTIVEMLNPLKV